MNMIYYVGISIDNSVLLESLATVSTEQRPKTTLDLFALYLVDDHQLKIAQQLLEQFKLELTGDISIDWKRPKQIRYDEEYTDDDAQLSLGDDCLQKIIAWSEVLYLRFSSAGLVDPNATWKDITKLPSLPLDKHRLKRSDSNWWFDKIRKVDMLVNASNISIYCADPPLPRSNIGSCIALKFGDGNMVHCVEHLTTDVWPNLSIALLPLSINDEEQLILAKNLFEDVGPDLVDIARRGTTNYDFVKSLAWTNQIRLDEGHNDDAFLHPTSETWAQFNAWYNLLHQRFSEVNLVDIGHEYGAPSKIPGMWLSKTRVKLFTKDATFCPTGICAYGAESPGIFSISLYKDGKHQSTMSPYHYSDKVKGKSNANLINFLTSPEFWRSPSEQLLTFDDVYRLTHVHRMARGYEWTDEMIKMFVLVITSEDWKAVVDIHGVSKGIVDIRVDSKEDARPLTLFCIASLYSQVHGNTFKYGFPLLYWTKYTQFAAADYLLSLDSLRFSISEVLESQCGSPVVSGDRWSIPEGLVHPNMVKFLNGKSKYSLLRTASDSDWCIGCTSEADIVLTTAEHGAKVTHPGRLHVRCIAPETTPE